MSYPPPDYNYANPAYPGQPAYPPPPQAGYAPPPQPAYPPQGYPPQQPMYVQQAPQVVQQPMMQNTTNIITTAAAPAPAAPKKKKAAPTYGCYIDKKQRAPVMVTCKFCGKNGMTVCEFEAGETSWFWCIMCALMGLTAGCCLIPFMSEDFMDCKHTCCHCHRELAKCKPS